MFESLFLDKEKIHENKFAFAIYYGFLVSKGHSLVVPREFGLTQPFNEKLK